MLFCLSACGVHQADLGSNGGKVVEKKRENLTSTSGEILSWIPNGYTGAIAIITEANSGDVLVQTWDQLLYRNEIYGFQVLLGEETKGRRIQDRGNLVERSWDFIVPAESEELADENNAGEVLKIKRTPLLAIEVMDLEAYQQLTWVGEYGISVKELVDADLLWNNDRFYFVMKVFTNVDHAELSDSLQYLKCEKDPDRQVYRNISCGNWVERLIGSRFSVFEQEKR